MSKIRICDVFIKPHLKVLIVFAISGVLFNIGLLALPFFEGYLAQCLVDILKGKTGFNNMLLLVVLFIGVMLFVQVARFFKRFFVRKYANDLVKNLREKLYDGVLKQTTYNSLGEITQRAVYDIEATAEGARKLATEIFDTGVLIISYEVAMFLLDWKIALITLPFFPLVFVIAKLLQTPVYKTSNDYKLSAEKVNNETFSLISNSLLYRVNGREKAVEKEFDYLLSDYEKKSIKANFLQNTMQPIYFVIAMIGVILIVFFGAKNVIGTGNVVWQIASFTTFISCYAKVADKSSKAAKLFNVLQKAAVSWRAIKPMLSDFENNNDSKQINEPLCIEDNKNQKVSIEFNNAKLFYGEHIIVDNFSFTASSGEIIGVTGPIASGKSTIGKAFLQEYPYEGSIKINGEELSKIEKSKLYDEISYLGHSPELMSFDIENNILLGRDVSSSELLKFVSLDKEIAEMDKNELTSAGNYGSRLSGGQQARVALARTIAKANSIIVLDDPFSAVDKTTEKEITERLKELSENRVIILISHRLSHFPSFDKVVWVENEKAVVSNHNELMKSCKKYRELYEIQEGVINE